MVFSSSSALAEVAVRPLKAIRAMPTSVKRIASSKLEACQTKSPIAKVKGTAKIRKMVDAIAPRLVFRDAAEGVSRVG